MKPIRKMLWPLLALSLGLVARTAVAESSTSVEQSTTAWDRAMSGQTSFFTEGATVRRAQHALNRELALSLNVDGRIGPQTTAAIRQYQAERGLPITGELDQATQQTLGVSAEDILDRAPASVEDTVPERPM